MAVLLKSESFIFSLKTTATSLLVFKLKNIVYNRAAFQCISHTLKWNQSLQAITIWLEQLEKTNFEIWSECFSNRYCIALTWKNSQVFFSNFFIHSTCLHKKNLRGSRWAIEVKQKKKLIFTFWNGHEATNKDSLNEFYFITHSFNEQTKNRRKDYFSLP